MAKNAEEGADAKSYLVALKDYIPAEGLALYIFAIGFLVPGANATSRDLWLIKLFCVAVGLIACAIITATSLDTANLSGKGLFGIVSEANRRRVVVTLVAWSALIAYVLATLEPVGYSVATVDVSRFLAIVAALWALALPVVARFLGVRTRT